MTMENDRTKNEAAIRELIDGYVNAVRAKDIDGVMSVYAPDLVAFDVVPPLQYVGAEAFRKVWQRFFETFQAPFRMRFAT
jgi:ketosteroid isomerase-like protein